LLNQLDDVAGLLAQVENAHRTGNNTFDITNADSVIHLSNQIFLDAQALKESTIIENQNTFWIKIILTIAGSVIFTSIIFIVWCKFRRCYVKKKLDEKPEITN
jgi:uncharacterized protein YdaL